jgi:hypothetical protein
MGSGTKLVLAAPSGRLEAGLARVAWWAMAKMHVAFALGLALVVPLGASAAEAGPTSHLGYFKSFWAFRHGSKPTDVEAKLEEFKVDVDERNGYLQAGRSDDESDGEEIYTFVMWRGPSDLRLFAFTEDESGPDSEHHKTTFWSYAQGKWTRRDDVAPRIDLRDFLDESKPIPPEMYRKVWLKFELPRVGTTIVVRPEAIEPQPSPVDESDQIGGEGFDERTYDQLVHGAKYESLELRWDKASGKFVKGAKAAKKPEGK